MSDVPLVAVLAGGAAKRMGADKATVDVAGRTMLEHVLTACRDAELEAVVVVRNDALPDLRRPHTGPLAGIEAALLEAKGRPIIAIAVDHPWVRPETLLALATATTTAVPLDDARLQVTCARYEAACLAPATAILDVGPAPVRTLFAHVEHVQVDETGWQAWGEDGRSWFSADTPEALAAGLDRFGAPKRR